MGDTARVDAGSGGAASPPVPKPPARVGGHERVLQPPRGLELNVRELVQERELLGFLTWRNVQVRYKQSLAGPGWAIVQPLLGMLIFAVVFGRFAKLPNDGIPYPVFYFTAFLIWTYVSTSITTAATSVSENAEMVSKVYFPRIFLPLAATLAGLLDLAIGTAVGIPLFLAYDVDLDFRLLLAFGPVLIAALATSGVGLFLSALNARYRDVRFAVPFLIQAGLFASPVAYSSSILPEGVQRLYGLNPIAGAIEGFRWCVTGQGAVTLSMVGLSFAVAVVTFIAGVTFFQRTDATIADVV
jgi:lipopolysaccharide transport system permease protein